MYAQLQKVAPSLMQVLDYKITINIYFQVINMFSLKTYMLYQSYVLLLKYHLHFGCNKYINKYINNISFSRSF